MLVKTYRLPPYQLVRQGKSKKRKVDGVGKSVDGVGFRPVKLTHPEGFRPV